MTTDITLSTLRQFLQRQRLAVVATVAAQGPPESALVGIAVTDQLEIIFDTLGHSRKGVNLRANGAISLVIGWGEDGVTVQYEGVADEPTGEELARLKRVYYVAYPDGPERAAWPGLTYFRVRPVWIRYSDFLADGGPKIVEFTEFEALNGS